MRTSDLPDKIRNLPNMVYPVFWTQKAAENALRYTEKLDEELIFGGKNILTMDVMRHKITLLTVRLEGGRVYVLRPVQDGSYTVEQFWINYTV